MQKKSFENTLNTTLNRQKKAALDMNLGKRTKEKANNNDGVFIYWCLDELRVLGLNSTIQP